MAQKTIYFNGKIATNSIPYFAEAMTVADGKIVAIGASSDLLPGRDSSTEVVDLGGHTVIPGLNDSHLHVIRGGLHYNLELRWDGVPSHADAMRMLKEQAARTPAPQWVRVVGGWTEFQFAERRMPTLAEINEAAPDTPVFVLHLYDRAMLNAAALRAVGYTKDTPDPLGGEIQRDKRGVPTGMLIARPNAGILYSTLAKGPLLSYEDQLISTRHFMRELNRLGITSAIDAGGGFQNYPDDYTVVEELHKRGQMTLRIAYNLFTQRPNHEIEDFSKWTSSASLYQGDHTLRLNGAGEMLVFSAADFEDFLEPRPDLDAVLETKLEEVVRLLAEKRWPFRLHATYNESIERFLNVFEKVNRDIPLSGLHWFFDHAETISDRNIERTVALGGGIAVQHRMAFQGEYFVHRYGAEAAKRTPPIRRMLQMGANVGAGTDATRVASFNPYVSLYWLVSGRTVGGLRLYDDANRMTREEALHLYTHGSSWFSTEEDVKGSLAPGQLADFAVLSSDYFAVAEEEIKGLQSVLTVVGGEVVYAAQGFSDLAPPPLPAALDWAPTVHYGGYHTPASAVAALLHHGCSGHHASASLPKSVRLGESLWGLGCDCFAF
ncbi:amidohydrolase [Terracidiphilus gabretensis]|uniref:amidohydrolase n=1 Tax=Terracidiphilus gabretensis TaxID=1577687 RepID=UPI00071BC9EC|nr:amidohydrolase [Terracidiphilus gabretensis]